MDRLPKLTKELEAEGPSSGILAPTRELAAQVWRTAASLLGNSRQADRQGTNTQTHKGRHARSRRAHAAARARSHTRRWVRVVCLFAQLVCTQIEEEASKFASAMGYRTLPLVGGGGIRSIEE